MVTNYIYILYLGGMYHIWNPSQQQESCVVGGISRGCMLLHKYGINSTQYRLAMYIIRPAVILIECSLWQMHALWPAAPAKVCQ